MPKTLPKRGRRKKKLFSCHVSHSPPLFHKLKTLFFHIYLFFTISSPKSQVAFQDPRKNPFKRRNPFTIWLGSLSTDQNPIGVETERPGRNNFLAGMTGKEEGEGRGGGGGGGGGGGAGSRPFRFRASFSLSAQSLSVVKIISPYKGGGSRNGIV